MTAQMPDILIYQAKQHELFTNPLDDYFRANNVRPGFVSPHTANWRGYVATWKIEEDKLFLTALKGWILRSIHTRELQEIGWELIFPYEKGPIFAEWYSGMLRIPWGELLHYVHLGYRSRYEKELLLYIKEGMLTGERILDNSEPPDPDQMF